MPKRAAPHTKSSPTLMYSSDDQVTKGVFHLDPRRHARLLLIMGLVLPSFPAHADGEMSNVAPSAAEAAKTSGDQEVFAVVNGKQVTFQDYRTLLAETMRQRFYHGNAPESQAEAVRKEVGDLLIERVLLVEEAERRGIKPDASVVEKALADIDARYASVPKWQQQRGQLLPTLREQIGQQNQRDQLEKQVRNVPQPTEDEVRAYVKQKPELFTEPENLRLSVILLTVDPSAPTSAWNEALEKAKAIHDRIKGGSDFAEEARLHSQDKTASNGGDLGYVHRGMLPEALHDKIDKFQIGVVSEPIVLLEGVALFRLDDRIAPKLHDFSEVRQRAQDLLRREQQDQAWRQTIKHLREAAKIQILSPIGDSGIQP